jgi:hypothetical protein
MEQLTDVEKMMIKQKIRKYKKKAQPLNTEKKQEDQI